MTPRARPRYPERCHPTQERPPMALVVFDTILSFDEGGANLHRVDTIEHQGKLWLVGQWLEVQAEGYRIPARIIYPPHRFQPNPKPEGPRYSLSGPVSKAV